MLVKGFTPGTSRPVHPFFPHGSGMVQCRVSVVVEHNETGTDGMPAYSRFIEYEKAADGCEMTWSCARMPSACAFSYSMNRD